MSVQPMGPSAATGYFTPEQWMNMAGNATTTKARPFYTGGIGVQSKGVPYANVQAPETATADAVVKGPDGQPLQGSPTWGNLDKWLMINRPQDYKAVKKQLKDAGATWGQVLDLASYSQAPVWDVLDQLAGQGGGSGSGGSSTSTSVTLSSQSQAAAILDNSLQQELGRRATEQEIKAFQKALNEAQSSNPTVTRTNSGSGYSSSTTTGGFDYQRFATEYAQSQEGYAENFAATNFMNLLDTAISAPTRIDQLLAGGK